MRRRKFLKQSLIVGGASAVSGTVAWHHFFDGPVLNACLLDSFPVALQQHELMQQALQGLNLEDVWDCHFHLVGNGKNAALGGDKSGIWLNPSMDSGWSITQRIQYSFYLNASCVEDAEYADKEYVSTIEKLLQSAPDGVKFMLLAFDYHHDQDGQINRAGSTFYVPNKYAAKVAASNAQLEWIGSVHPYREDAIEQLEWCALNGAKAIKWLPPAMNIDPASNKCEAFYQKMIELGLPLLTHAGEEKAVHSDELQKLANPLFLRMPLDMGVKVIVAHCASLGQSEDIESNGKPMVQNFDLFARLMDSPQYQHNLLADISAVNLFNREIDEIKRLLNYSHWHSRLLYGSDYPLPGVMPIISSTNLASHGLLDEKLVPFLNEVRIYNPWLFDLLQKRFLNWQGTRFSDEVFSTRRHFGNQV